MTVEERVADFLMKNKGQAYCDDCLASELGINRHQARNATSGLAASGRFHRDYGACSKRHHDRDKKHPSLIKRLAIVGDTPRFANGRHGR